MKSLSRVLFLSVFIVLMSLFSPPMLAVDIDIGFDEPPTKCQVFSLEDILADVYSFNVENIEVPPTPKTAIWKPNMQGVSKSFIVALSYYYSNGLSIPDIATTETIIEEKSRFFKPPVFDYPLSYGLAYNPGLKLSNQYSSNEVENYPLSYGLSSTLGINA